MSLELPHSLLLLRAWLEPRRALLAANARVAFATLEGERFTLDPSHPELVHRDWDAEGADVVVLTNHQTFADLLSGDFDPRRPRSEHLFMWAGDESAWQSLEKATRESKSAFEAQLGHLRR